MKNKPFIYAALPGESFKAYTLKPKNEIGETGFVLSGFTGLPSFFDVEDWDINTIDFNALKLSALQESDIERSGYIDIVDEAIKAIKKGTLHKVVLSRTQTEYGEYNTQKVLQNLKDIFPETFVYALSINDTLWIGASPEVLVKANGALCVTYALAGTKRADSPFTSKENNEQLLVVKYITDKLSNIAEKVRVSSSKSLKLNNIHHILTTISFETENLLKVAEKLHPTPAILGLPEIEALDFIQQHEKHARELYAGYLGFYTKEDSNVFVNLRCAQVFSNAYRLYAGGGIVQGSIAENEWEETEQKVATFKHILNQNKLGDI